MHMDIKADGGGCNCSNCESAFMDDSVLTTQKNSTILLIGDFVEPNLGSFLVQLSNLPSKTEPVTVKLTSSGGSINIGFAIHDLIVNRGNVRVEVYGYACSAAILALMAADVRTMSANSRLMIHQTFLRIDQDANITMKDLTDQHRELDVSYKTYCNIIAKRTGLSLKKVLDMCAAETFFSAKEAKKLNLIDVIL